MKGVVCAGFVFERGVRGLRDWVCFSGGIGEGVGMYTRVLAAILHATLFFWGGIAFDCLMCRVYRYTRTKSHACMRIRVFSVSIV